MGDGDGVGSGDGCTEEGRRRGSAASQRRGGVTGRRSGSGEHEQHRRAATHHLTQQALVSVVLQFFRGSRGCQVRSRAAHQPVALNTREGLKLHGRGMRVRPQRGRTS